jgi:adenine deaminase
MIVDVPHVEDKSVKNTMRVKKITSERFKIRIKGNKVRVIELIPEQIYTRHLIEGVTKDIDGEVKADPSRDLAKIAVIERHRATGNIGLGFVRGFSLKHGAIGSSVAHDSHNIIIVGTNDRDMYLTAQKIIELGGGHVVVSNGKVLGSLALPIAGLLSESRLEDLVMEEQKLLDGVKSLGVKLQSPFFKLSFLSLPVIPELKITDLGLVDVSKFDIVDLEP